MKKNVPPVRLRPIALDQCYVAPENARAELPPENIEELAANIAEYGLLQPLVGYVDDRGGFAIIGGRRRLAALTKLKAQGSKKVDWDSVPLAEIAQSDAIGASLSENTQRVDLGVVEAALQFNRMTIDGKSTAEIAKAFGVTERFIKGRMRLASLHEPILEALRKGEISLDVAQMYAGAVTARQERVWKALGKSSRTTGYRVREELKKNTLLAGDALARFVGEDAYVAAGGVVEHELFTTPDNSRWLDPALAERLGQEKLAAEAAALEGEGFLFVDAAISMPYGKYADGNLGKPRKASADEKARVKAIDERLKALRKEYTSIETACEARDTADERAEYTDAESDRMTAIEDEEIDLRNAKETLEDSFYDFDDAAKKKSGVAVTLNGDGTLAVTRGVISPKDRKVTPAGKTKAKGKAASAKPSKPEPQAAMTNLTHEKTSRLASIIVGRTLASNPAIALVAVTAAAARDVIFGAGGYGNTLQVREFDAGLQDNPELLSDADYEKARKRWEVALNKQEEKLEESLATWSQSDLLELLAFCVGHSVKTIEANAARDHSKDSSRRQLITLARLSGANPAAHFIPDADYLGGLSRPSLDAALAELGISSAGLKTKAAIAQAVADKAKGGGATAAWVPPLLRTLCGMDAKPAAKKTAPVKKVAKKATTKTKVKKAVKKPARAVVEARA